MLNTVRWSIEKEEIHRGADPLSGHQSFLVTNDKTLELPVLNHLSFTEQGHTNAQHRTNTAPGLDDTFAWFLPGRAGDHDMKFGMQYLFDQNVLDDQGSMNGAFSFSSDKEFNAADPSTYPERLTIRVPIGAHTSSHEHSFAFYGQDKWRMTKKITLNLGLRYDVDVFPFKQTRNPLVTDGYPIDKNNFQPRAGLAYNIDGKSVVRAGIGKYYEKLFLGQLTPLQSSGVFGDSFIVNFPVNGPDPGPSRGQLPTDPMLGETYSRPSFFSRMSASNSLNVFAGPELCTANTLGGPLGTRRGCAAHRHRRRLCLRVDELLEVCGKLNPRHDNGRSD